MVCSLKSSNTKVEVYGYINEAHNICGYNCYKMVGEIYY